jgi:putative flippase GtrA
VIARQFLSFAVIGVVGFCVDSAVLMLVVSALGANLYIGRLVSFLTAATATWGLNRRFTFSHAASTSQATEWLRFVLCNAIGGGVNFGAYSWLVANYAVAHEFPVLGVACGSMAGMLVNFSMTKIFVFRTGAVRST